MKKLCRSMISRKISMPRVHDIEVHPVVIVN